MFSRFYSCVFFLLDVIRNQHPAHIVHTHSLISKFTAIHSKTNALAYHQNTQFHLFISLLYEIVLIRLDAILVEVNKVFVISFFSSVVSFAWLV